MRYLLLCASLALAAALREVGGGAKSVAGADALPKPRGTGGTQDAVPRRARAPGVSPFRLGLGATACGGENELPRNSISLHAHGKDNFLFFALRAVKTFITITKR